MTPELRATLQRGLVIPACPLALTAERRLDVRHQRALFRYYAAAGAGGIAVGVHTTQFEIREPQHGLFRPLLQLAAEEIGNADVRGSEPLVRIAGVCGPTSQASAEATLIRETGFHVGLLSLAAMRNATEDKLIAHCREIAQIIPLVGFYLQPAVGGRSLSYSFWRRFAEIEQVVAIKTAPFNRYQTLDVVRAVAESGRQDIAIYTGNDDNLVADLLTPYRFNVNGQLLERQVIGGLLGHWAVWTRKAAELLDECHAATRRGEISTELLRHGVETTDANAALFDAANGYAGCIPGIHWILHRQGLLATTNCLDAKQALSAGQADELERVCRAYPHLSDDAFVREHLDEWLRD